MEKEEHELIREYELLRKKFSKYKDQISKNEEVKKAETFIKEHPFVSVAIALVLGAALAKAFEKKKG
jgi:ElaB/YqjD/DUF883 family membrane-anchored ribosome-binding protein